MNTIQPYWEEMEELVSANKVISLGICDLIKNELEELYNWAKVKSVTIFIVEIYTKYRFIISDIDYGLIYLVRRRATSSNIMSGK